MCIFLLFSFCWCFLEPKPPASNTYQENNWINRNMCMYMYIYICTPTCHAYIYILYINAQRET